MRRRRIAGARRSGCTARRRWAGCCSARRSGPSAPAVRRDRLRVRVQRRRRDRGCRRASRSASARTPTASTAAIADRVRSTDVAAPSPPDLPNGERRPPLVADSATSRIDRPAMRLLNRGLVAAIVINAGGYYARRHLRGHLEPVPPGSRRGPRADRADVRDVRGCRSWSCRRSPAGSSIVAGSLGFIVARMVLPAVAGIRYTLIRTRSWRSR